MANWKLTLSYDGTAFNGWQVQPGLPTIQGTLQRAIADVTRTSIADTPLPQGSGRTDAGVHALGQVASLALAAPIPPENLLRALNHALPPGIRILSAEPVPDTFHARHSVLSKTYEYRIFERYSATDTAVHRICPPFLAPYAWDCRWPLALEPMQKAAALFCGTHNFTSFAAYDPDLTLRRHSDLEVAQNDLKTSKKMSARPKSMSSRPERGSRSGETPVFVAARAEGASVQSLTNAEEADSPEKPSGPNPIKTIHTSTLTHDHDLLIYRILGTGFLHHMVRNIVGTLIEVGRGALTPGDIHRILAAGNRSAAGPTAPAHGLYLVQVDYPSPYPNGGEQ